MAPTKLFALGLCALIAAFFSFGAAFAADGVWTPAAFDGLGDATNTAAPAMAVLGGELYVGTGGPNGAMVFKYDGATWSKVGSNGLDGDIGNTSTLSLAVFDGQLYAGTFRSGGGRIYRLSSGAWQAVFTSGNYQAIAALATDGSKLFAGSAQPISTPPPEVLGSSTGDSGSWTAESVPGLPLSTSIASMAAASGILYVGGGSAVYRYSSGAWAASPIGEALTDFPSTTSAIPAMTVSGSDLIVSIRDGAGGQIYEWNGSVWTQLGTGAGFGLGITTVTGISPDGRYIGGEHAAGGVVLEFNGSTWENLTPMIGFWDGGKNPTPAAMAFFKGDLYVGVSTNGSPGCEIWRQSSSYRMDFPAGSTAADYRNFSIPTDLGEVELPSILDPQIGPYDPTLMRLGHWDAGTQAYDEYPPAVGDTVEAGDAAWALFRNGQTVFWSGDTPDGPVFHDLEAGWNQVGNPYPFPIAMSAATVGDSFDSFNLWDPGNTVTQQAFWVYKNGTYFSVDEVGLNYILYPGQGGWIKMNSSMGFIEFPNSPVGWNPTSVAMITAPASEFSTRSYLEQPPAPPGVYAPGDGGASGGGGGGCFAGAIIGE
jgi:hypothetical protein